MNTNLGNKIRELRKRKSLTQEALADALSVSPQAVSKWEMNISYPDMSLIPVLAAYFEVSLDTLFDYDLKEVKKRVSDIIEKSWKHFFELEKAEAILKSGLKEYPSNAPLLRQLLSVYDSHLYATGDESRLDDMIDIANQIISGSADFPSVCSAKDSLAAAYLKKGEYEIAKKTLETLPDEVATKAECMACRLSGEDKLNAAEDSRRESLQKLYIACKFKGDALSDLGRHKEALKSYGEGQKVIELFMESDKTEEGSYLCLVCSPSIGTLF